MGSALAIVRECRELVEDRHRVVVPPAPSACRRGTLPRRERRRLVALEVGDKLWLGPKITGMFTLDQVPGDHHLILVATGTGLAPYMSMLRSSLVCGGTRRFAVLHGARHSWDLGYRSELNTLRRMCSNFKYLPIISRPEEEHVPWSGAVGHVQDLWRHDVLEAAWGEAPAPENSHVFLCGHPRMVEDMSALLAPMGFTEHSRKTPGTIHVERYW